MILSVDSKLLPFISFFRWQTRPLKNIQAPTAVLSNPLYCFFFFFFKKSFAVWEQLFFFKVDLGLKTSFFVKYAKPNVSHEVFIEEKSFHEISVFSGTSNFRYPLDDMWKTTIVSHCGEKDKKFTSEHKIFFSIPVWLWASWVHEALLSHFWASVFSSLKWDDT